jgi:MFS family permease
MALASSPIVSFTFLRLLSFRFLIVLSYQMLAIVAGWHIYELTHNALALGFIGLAEVIPYFASALFAGHAVDHYSRRLFGVMASVMVMASALMLTAVSSGMVEGNPVWWLYGAIAFNGLARAFISPSYSAMFALVLPREEYAKASGIGSSVFQLGLVTGPALGGLLAGWFGNTAGYAVAAVLAFGAAVALFSVRVSEPPSAESMPIFASIATGVRFVFSNQIILGAQSLDMFAVLFGGAVALLPAFIKDVFHFGPEAFGVLRAMPAIGAVITGLYLARHPLNHHAGRWLLGAVAGFGVCIIGFALSTTIWMAGLLLLLSGICDGVSVVMRTAIMQLLTPDDMRGRVAAINGIFIGSSNELGAFESGVAAHVMGLVPSVIFGGFMTLGVVAVTAKLAPKLRRLDLQQLY